MSALLAVGQTCSHPACDLVDFLPFKCQHCSQPFCSDHYKPESGHTCANFDPTKYNRVAPECPFCQKPVAFGPGVDPNVAMETHFETKCEVASGGGTKQTKGSSAPRCARGKCNKVLIAPIRCPVSISRLIPPCSRVLTKCFRPALSSSARNTDSRRNIDARTIRPPTLLPHPPRLRS